ncbi:hypothetical protein OG196_15480 [Kitasatospora purpeofusca]|uniref:SMODS-associated NUDIX domain-containing protein n=1 Tax=Kitasatospora purpeofusca TaxID=67352 RepID=UPI002E141916|nr:hypothetical protein OG196_15480 [Kitasatospora purpeofusca]
MTKIIAYFAACITLLAGGFIFPNSTLGDIFTGGFLALLAPLGIQTFAGRIHLRHFWYSLRYSRRDVRISAAYLFRIKVDGKYLLVRGARFPQYQPVGGVFKASAQGITFLQGIGARDDDLVGVDSTSEADLRIRIKGRHLSKFYAWYDTREGREDAPWREFHEELIKSNIIPANEFPYIFHNYVGRIVERIRFSEYADSLEILIADIYELLPNPSQEALLRATIAESSELFKWVDGVTIQRRGAVPGQPQQPYIAAHSAKIL